MHWRRSLWHLSSLLTSDGKPDGVGDPCLAKLLDYASLTQGVLAMIVKLNCQKHRIARPCLHISGEAK